ncbi:hypothetical protein TL16_g06221 [Triparma laevis f. inornata]|uniref:Uncharacterized protein n=1 Tax=Triparma laevis f. inornata TaxID=1714386 RepID=A0A9W7AQB3_9STRA|nr:hypothetical protein TL16_g06221 [Triparma laevis f. inornata]
MHFKTAFLTLLFLSALSQATFDHDQIPLDEYGMIMVHDAASGYLDTNNIVTKEVYDWTRTQDMPTHSAADLLFCGARSFDWRPSYKESKLQAHHGDVTIEHTFSDTLDEITFWAAANPTELVIMHIWDCVSDDSGDCTTEVLKELSFRNLTAIDDCNKLNGITVGEAKALAQAPSSGLGLVLPIMPTTGNTGGQACSAENYDESIACWGTKSFTKSSSDPANPDVFDCIELENINVDALYKDLSVEEKNGLMTTYMDKVSQAGPSQGSVPMYQIQALWEESVASVVIGELHLSSLIEDEAKSKLNALTASYVNADRFPNLNYIEVNNVCDGGPELLAALSAFNDKHASARK